MNSYKEDFEHLNMKLLYIDLPALMYPLTLFANSG